MLKGIANYRCASYRRCDAHAKARIRALFPSLPSSLARVLLFILPRTCSIIARRHDDERASVFVCIRLQLYPLIRLGGCVARSREEGTEGETSVYPIIRDATRKYNNADYRCGRAEN